MMKNMMGGDGGMMKQLKQMQDPAQESPKRTGKGNRSRHGRRRDCGSSHDRRAEMRKRHPEQRKDPRYEDRKFTDTGIDGGQRRTGLNPAN